MNKNYIKSLINEMFDQNILNSEDDRAYIKELIYDEGHEHELSGNFDEDLEYLKGLWEEEEVVSEEDTETPEENIEEVVGNIHIGFNYIPGIGVGFCRDEEDLARMKDFVRGGLAVQELAKMFFGI